MKPLLLLTVLGLFVLAGCTNSIQYQESASTNNEQSPTGRMVVTMTDAAADMEAVTSIKVTVNTVEVHSASQGWVTLSQDTKTYDLLALDAESRSELMADSSLDSGAYNQVRFHIESVVITDDKGDHTAKVPSEEYKVNINTEVSDNETTAVQFDIIAEESLHETGNGEFILAPVARIDIKTDAQVDVSNEADVRIGGGSLLSSVKVGMDVDGNVGVGLNIPANAILNVTTGSTNSVVNVVLG